MTPRRYRERSEATVFIPETGEGDFVDEAATPDPADGACDMTEKNCRQGTL